MRAIYTVVFGRALLWNAVYFFLPLLLTERGLPGLWQGVLLAAVPFSGVLFAPLAGVLADRLSPRLAIVCGLALGAAFMGGLALELPPAGLLLAFVAGGLGVQLAQVGSDAYVLKLLRTGLEGAGVAGLLAANVLAMALGLAIGGTLLQGVDLRSALLALALGQLALAVFARATLVAIRGVPIPRGAYVQDLRRPRVALLLALCLLTRAHWGTESANYAPFLAAAHGLDRAASGLFMAGPIVVLGATSLWAGTRLDRGARPLALIAVGAVVAGIGHVGFTLPESLGGAFAWRVVHEAGEAALLVGVLRELSSLFPKERIGGPAGILSLVGNLAAGLGALGAAPLGAALGHALPQQLGGALMVLGALLVPLIARAPRAALAPTA